MIDFTTQQLSWIVVGACSLGGTGYLTVNNSMQEIDKKLEVSVTKMEYNHEQMIQVQKQLDRIEEKLSSRKLAK